MNVQEILPKIKRLKQIASTRGSVRLIAEELDSLVTTLEQHEPPKPDGRAGRGEANVIQSAGPWGRWIVVGWDGFGFGVWYRPFAGIWTVCIGPWTLHRRLALSRKRNSSEPTG
jgi:hypothetical protein